MKAYQKRAKIEYLL
jgi:hypothetical protein